MEISLKKIELVKDRTGVSYKEAKEALIKAIEKKNLAICENREFERER